jgi:pSer/pThr/pTyr-binding forkhead associated (FHA) protein
MGLLPVVEQHTLSGRTLSISARLTIGRESCDVILPDPEVSRSHAVLDASGGPPTIEDLGSTNGTYVNDDRIQTAEAHHGDVLRFGNTVWHVVAPSTSNRGCDPGDRREQQLARRERP